MVKTKNDKLSYKIAYCSDNEDFGMHNKKDWFDWLKEWRREIEAPVKVTIR